MKLRNTNPSEALYDRQLLCKIRALPETELFEIQIIFLVIGVNNLLRILECCLKSLILIK